MASDVDTATKMITDSAADDVECIFGTAFKEDMNDEMTITVIAAGFENIGGEPTVKSIPTSAPVENTASVNSAVTPEPTSVADDTPSVPTPEPVQEEKTTSTIDDDSDLTDIYKLLDNY